MMPKPPTQKTLDKYGMTHEQWVFLYHNQNGLCALCGRVPKLWNIDHRHVRGYAKLSPGLRLGHVRALLCSACNRWLLGPTHYGFTAEQYRLAADYLDAHS
jgi:hypothetical protein